MNNINVQDDKLKELLSGTKINAPENLKFRIMQQIETEKALSRKKGADTSSVLTNMMSIYGVMYAIIAVLGCLIYSTAGKAGLESTGFYVPVILISVLCGVYWLLSSFDEHRREKRQK